MKLNVPNKQYKYRAFSARTVELLCRDALYFADPSTFNDPLDCRPSVEADSDVDTLRRLLRKMVQQRVHAEMSGALVLSKIGGPKSVAHAQRWSDAAAQRELDDIAYHATNPEYAEDAPNPELWLLTDRIECELLRRGGLCIGYSPTKYVVSILHQVTDSGSRKMLTSIVAAMVLNSDDAARKQVDTAVLLRKAPAWRYEREWRLLGPRGRANSSLELSEVIFGLRCDSGLVHAVTSALNSRERSVDFYEMYEVPGTFRIKRRRVDEDELGAHFSYRSLSAEEAFASVEDDDPSVK